MGDVKYGVIKVMTDNGCYQARGGGGAFVPSEDWWHHSLALIQPPTTTTTPLVRMTHFPNCLLTSVNGAPGDVDDGDWGRRPLHR